MYFEGRGSGILGHITMGCEREESTMTPGLLARVPGRKEFHQLRREGCERSSRHWVRHQSSVLDTVSLRGLSDTQVRTVSRQLATGMWS